MKKILLFLAVASTTMFVSCSDDDSKKDGNDPDAATSIVLAANIATIEAASGESVILTVTDNKTNVVTSDATFFANDVEISSSTFTSDVEGDFVLKATYTNENGVVLTSNTVTVTVTPAVVIPEAKGKYTFNGTDYAIDNMIFQLDGNSTDGASIYNVTLTEGGEPVPCTLWMGVAYNGVLADLATSSHYYQYTFYLPVVVDGEGTPTALNFPGDVAAVVDGIYAEEDLTPFDLDAVTGGTVTFTSFVQTQGAATVTENSSSFTDGTNVVISHDFDGALDGTGTGIFYGDLANKSAKGVSKTIPTQKLNKAIAKFSKKVVRK